MREDLMDSLVLSDGELVIRPAQRSDEELMAGWLQDPRIYQWWGGEPASKAHVLEHCSIQHDESETSWPFIIVAGSDEAGYIQAWQSSPKSGGIDLFVAPEHRRKGIATRAARMLATHLRDICGWTRVTADPDPANIAGAAMWRKAGFVPEPAGVLYVFR